MLLAGGPGRSWGCEPSTPLLAHKGGDFLGPPGIPVPSRGCRDRDRRPRACGLPEPSVGAMTMIPTPDSGERLRLLVAPLG